MKKINYTNYKKPSDFMKFSEGENRIRVVSSGIMGYQHVMKTKTRFVNLGFCSERENCKHCLAGNEPKRFWKWIVFDFDRQDVKILDAGPMIGNQLSDMGGDPQEFDVIITRSGSDLQTKYDVKKADEDIKMSEDILTSMGFRKKRLIEKYFK